jgi:dihydroxyacid dehydratase/phosphogluconate dehydratase
MRELPGPHVALAAWGSTRRRSITDGRFSARPRRGDRTVSPEAALDGPIGSLREGDRYGFDIPGRGARLWSAQPSSAPRGHGHAFVPRVTTGGCTILRQVTSAFRGAV